MALEDTMERLIDALNQNTKAHGGAAATPGRAAPPKKSAALTLEMVRAALMSVKDAHNVAAAKKIITGIGKAKEVNGIKPAQFAAVIEACDEIMNAEENTEEGVEEEEL